MPDEFIKPVAQIRYLFWFLVALYFIALVLFFGISFTPVVDQTILIGWSAAGAICLYSASVFRHSTFRIQVVFFLLYGAGLTVLLMLNDLFRLEDKAFNIILHTAQIWFWALIAILLVAFLILFINIIKNSFYIILLFAIVLYTLSRLVEVVSEVIAPDLVSSLADLLEFLAMVSWAAYFIRTCSELTKAETLDAHEPPLRGPVERLEEELREEETQLEGELRKEETRLSEGKTL